MSELFRNSYLTADDLHKLVRDVEEDITEFPDAHSVLAIANHMVQERHYLHEPKTGKPSVSRADVEWFWSEMKRIYVERGGKEDYFPPLVPPITFG